ncbi:glycosyltransferase family 2 protein [Candidatus Shapirobacteria bacterium]|nr:glycosyltransferase family 2 protein [Candidatus Shapirobacteria bacterium]
MKLSIIIPVYNEEKTVAEIIKKVFASPIKLEKEVIVVNDGSTDDSLAKIKRFKRKNLKVISHKKNQGKGMAIRTGLKKVTGQIVLIQDADLELNPRDYPALLGPILTGKAKVVYGTRWAKRGNRRPGVFYLGNLFLTGLTNFLYKTDLSDMYCGYKVFKTEVLKNISLACRRFEFCPEVTAKLTQKDIKIVEVPIRYQPRNIFFAGKKLKWYDGGVAAVTLLKYRFNWEKILTVSFVVWGFWVFGDFFFWLFKERIWPLWQKL